MLATERLLLRPWRPADREGLWRMQSDPRTMEFLIPVPDRAASDQVADRAEAYFARHGFGLWVVEAPGVSDFAGYCGLVHVPYAEHFTPAVEIGWRFDPALWGRGYATEAAHAALAFGFDRLGLTEIVAITVPANARSRALMQRLGMTHDERGDFDLPTTPEGHPLRRQVLYRLKAGGAAQVCRRPPA
ncbi:GNAT family N-acetyltransferase [Xanthobacter tagetidis]|uniref:GNAT family N-acetyltransferase n=1 Tax=Xanthobacter tagetidis TaxID=60216 RepID=UPI00179B7085|nr:GNAT family N-acetyltransferase [Xanthobacter tagetidis]MBB6305861.1 RimJ/RimL family protein N-acetyltransferase [Xanthobacter tagetidis]